MAKFFVNGKWKKRALTALSVTLCLSLSAGILAACGGSTTDSGDEETEDPVATETDTQLLKNGNFEFYSDKEKEREDKRTFLYSPTSWSFTSGSPSSDTRSGILNLNEFDDLTKSGRAFTDVADAYAHWKDEDVTVYDRLKFLTDKKEDIKNLASDSAEKKLFDEYNYSMDFEDVEAISKYFTEEKKLTPAHSTEEDSDKKDEQHVLMIHNTAKSNNVAGTGQYYTSGTTITLEAGTAAEVSVWVRTDDLYHYTYDTDKTEGETTIPAEHPNGIPVERYAGAYIGVTNTVGGTTLDQMQIKNINTKGEWQKYTVYVQANTYATSTFKLVLGLGQSTSDNRYEAVNGYAFFDDVSCKIIDANDFPTANPDVVPDANKCDLTNDKKEKTFDATETKSDLERTYSLDLKGTTAFGYLQNSHVTVKETTELSGNEERKAPVKGDASVDIATWTGFESGKEGISSLAALAESNGYLKNIYEKDFGDRFFKNKGDGSDDVILLLSASGAPYTATMTNTDFTLHQDEHMLISFFVKTSSIRSGKSGAGITLVDGVNETSITPFDSTTVDTVDVDENNKDIRNGWVQCFFFVENETDADKTFSLKFTYGPTAVADTTVNDYCDGYAAFANFEYVKNISTELFGYASTGTYAKKVSLTGSVTPTAKFDDASVTSDIERDLATPVSFSGVQSGSISMTPGGTDNPTKAELAQKGVYTGLLNAKHQANYNNTDWGKLFPQATGVTDWWQGAFYDKENPAKVANQPLVIVNSGSEAQPSYGYLNKTETVSADSYRKISLRVKLSAGQTANVYLIDTSDAKKGYNDTLKPVMPNVTYWYDDDGNICTKDPNKDGFNKRTDIAFYKQENGLYTRVGETNGTYYANLKNYDTDGNGNKITSDETIAYYAHGGAFWAYYDKTKTGDAAYAQQVKDLQEASGFDSAWIRYSAPAEDVIGKFVSRMTVTGTAENADGWTEVAFYVRTGSEQKVFRLEVWAGDRTDTAGLKANSYVFFDDYKSESVSSDYNDLLNEAVSDMKDKAGLGEKENLTENALYYAFTYYDSPSYLRYDATQDTDKLGDPHGSYKQSEHSEQLIALLYETENTLFLDYSAYNVNVPEDDLGGEEEEEPAEETEETSDANIWLLVASGAVAAALIFAIVAVIVQRAVKASRKNTRAKAPKKDKKTKLKVVQDEDEKSED